MLWWILGLIAFLAFYIAAYLACRWLLRRALEASE